MSKGVNKWIGIGNIGVDPILRSTTTGISVTQLSIATSEKWKDKSSGETKEEVQWHSVTLYGALADVAATYCGKGDRVYVEGSIRYKTVVDSKTNQKKYFTEIKATNLVLLGDKGTSSGEGPGHPAVQNVPDDTDDDIPF